MNPELTPILIITLFLVIVAIGIIMLVLLYQKKQMQNIKEREQLRAIFEREILESKLEIQEQTFKNISQEIHDNIGQELIFAKLTLNALDSGDPFELKERMQNSSDLITKALQDLRHLSKSLNTENIAELGLVQAIDVEVETIRKTGKYKLNFSKGEAEVRLTEQQQLILFRIFQETVNNIIKHSNATEINICIESSNEKLVLRIKDNGNGFDIDELYQRDAKQKGLGLRNMKNRTEIIGGYFDLISAKGEGTSIVITLPIITTEVVH